MPDISGWEKFSPRGSYSSFSRSHAHALPPRRKSRRRRSVDETVLESRDEVNENAHSVSVLIALAEGKPEMIEKLNRLYDKLLYLTPSAEEEVAVIDEKIGNAILFRKFWFFFFLEFIYLFYYYLINFLIY